MDVKAIKVAAREHWVSLIRAAYGDIPWDSRKEHPCPKCGGNTRFRYFGDRSGGALCSHCYNTNNGDGISTIMWLTGWTFLDTLKFICKELGLENQIPTQKKIQSNLVEIEWSHAIADQYCTRKGIRREALAKVNCRMAKYRMKTVIIVPIYGNNGSECGQIMLCPDGTGIEYRGKRLDKMIVPKSRSGFCLDVKGRPLNASDKVLKVEGVTDLLAAISSPEFFDGCVITNSAGAIENPKDWMIDLMAGKQVTILHDADIPGKNGALKWEKALATNNQTAHLKQLPYPLEPKKGKDLRDWLQENPGKSIDDIPDMQLRNVQLVKRIDDPSRLAELNIQKYESEYERCLRFYRAEWHKWDGIKYRLIKQHELRAKVRAVIQEEFERYFAEEDHDEETVRPVNQTLVDNVIHAMGAMRLVPDSRVMPCWLDGEDGPKNIITLQNGLLDVDAFLDGRLDECLIPNTQKWFSANAADYEFDPNATCEKWLRILKQIVPCQYTRCVLQEFVGYCLLPQTFMQKALLLWGQGGNGKGTFTAGVHAIIGAGNVSSLGLERFGDKFVLSSMMGKLVNISNEFSNSQGLEEGLLKSLISGDPVSTDRKFLDEMSFTPTTRFIVSTNVLPKFKDQSDGTFRRWLAIPFNNRFDNTDSREFGLDQWQTWIENGEAPGMLLWALQGLGRLRKMRRFSVSDEIDRMENDFRNEANSARLFMLETLVPDEAGAIPKNELYNKYRAWCQENGHYPKSKHSFGKNLSALFPGRGDRKMRPPTGGPYEWYYTRLTYRIVDDEYEEEQSTELSQVDMGF